MQLKPGSIVSVKSNAGKDNFVIIQDIENSDYLSLPVLENKNNNISDKYIYEYNDSFIYISRPVIISENDVVELLSIIENKTLDSIIRSYVKHSADGYYNVFKKPAVKNYLPPSGKVLDSSDLSSLIDSSLDMWLTTGRFNDQFEKDFASKLGIKYALTVNSGSSANLVAMTALTSSKLGDRRIKKGDEVITVAAGFPTTISPIIQNGLIPVFVDVEMGLYNIDPAMLEAALSDKTKAIFIAHTLGNPFKLDAVLDFAENHGLWVIEDNCDALGSTYNGKYTGTHGHIGTFSFYPAHHITMGEGGAVVTSDNELYRIMMSVRDWGRDCWCPPGKDDTCGKRFEQQHGNMPFGYDHKYIYSHLGYNLKITDWQAAIGLTQLSKLDDFVKSRRENHRKIKNGLMKWDKYLILPDATEKSDPSWFGFVITVKEGLNFTKNDLVKYLEDNKIGTRNLFAGNILRQPAFTNSYISLRILDSGLLNSNEIDEKMYNKLPQTDKIMNGTFWIGVWPGLNDEDIRTILNVFDNFFNKFS